MTKRAPVTINRQAGWWALLPWGSGLLFVALAAHAAVIETPTVDEFAHLPAGAAAIRHQRLDLYSKNPPLLKAIIALPGVAGGATVPEVYADPYGWGPWRYGYAFMLANPDDYLRWFTWGRLVVVTIAAAGGFLVFHWARALYGGRAASVAASFYFLSPNILAHGHLATLDLGCAVSMTAALAAMAWTFERRSLVSLAAAGTAWGAALLIKFTAVLLLPALVVLAVWPGRERWWKRLLRLVLAASLAVVVLNAGYLFQGTGRPLGQFDLVSSTGRAVQKAMPASLPVPLPADFVQGFDQQKRDVESGEYPGYLFGRWSQDGWWYYDLVALGVKVALPVWVALFLALFVRPPTRSPVPSDAGDEHSDSEEPAVKPTSGASPAVWCGGERWLVVPMLVLLASLILLNDLQIGVRYFLPLLPVALIWTGRLWRTRAGAWLALPLLISLLVPAIARHPEHLRWFNPVLGGPQRGHEVLLDSNLDWGQDLYRVPEALAALEVEGPVGLLYFGHVHPAVYGIEFQEVPRRPEPGVYVVSLHYLMGGTYMATRPDGTWIEVDGRDVQWLRDVEPVQRLGSLWIYDTR